MKKFLIAFCVLSCYFNGVIFAQENNKVIKSINKFNYVKAAKSYENLIEEGKSNVKDIKDLADLYFMMQKYDEAVKLYALALQSSQDGKTLYNYAQCLIAKGNLAEYNKQMGLFVEKLPNDSRAIAYKNQLNYLPELALVKSRKKVTSLNFNSSFSDFGGLLDDGKFYFATSRNGRKYNRINPMTGEPFRKIYQAELLNGNLDNLKEVHSLNSRSNDGLVCFNQDNTIAYFSSSTININNYSSRANKFKGLNYEKQQIFSVTKNTAGIWIDHKALPFCNKDFTYLNPSLSPDGKFLYFASDATGTFGGLDIWRVEIISNNSFGEPQNLGPNVNTVFDENFPSVSQNNQNLYFASKGHENFGGYDIFEFNLSNNQSKSQNIGIPFNSPQDDFAFYYYDDQQVGFLSSSRNGNSDIYKIELPVEEYFQLKLSDPNTSAPLSQVEVLILNENGNVIQKLTSDQNGVVMGNVPFQKNYTIKVENEAFEPYETKVVNSFRGIPNQALSLISKPKPVVEIPAGSLNYKTSTILFEFDKFELNNQSKEQLSNIVELMSKNEEIQLEIVAHTDARGSEVYNLKLSEKRAKAALNFLVSQEVNSNRVQIKPMGESQPLIDCGLDCSEEEFAKNRRNEFVIILPNGQKFISE